jgi:hypothetical protein
MFLASCSAQSSHDRKLRQPPTRDPAIRPAQRNGLPRRHVERYEVTRHRYLVRADATNARDLRVEPGVVVAEETDSRARACNRFGEAFGFAPVPASNGAVLASPGELDARRSVVQEEDVNAAVAAQVFALVTSEVAHGQSL